MPDPTPTTALTGKIRSVLEEALDADLPSGKPDFPSRLRAVELILRPNAGVRSEAEGLPETAIISVELPDDIAKQFRAQARPTPRPRGQQDVREAPPLRPEDALPPPPSRAGS
jgi:hypothetical protein